MLFATLFVCLLCRVLLACFLRLFLLLGALGVNYFSKTRNILRKLAKSIKNHLFLLLLDCSWPLLGRFWPLLGRSGALLGRSWALLGRSWGALGRSWAALGRSWAALGRSWGALGTTCKNQQKIDAKNDRFGLPKASQNDPKIDQKNDQKSMQKSTKNRCQK